MCTIFITPASIIKSPIKKRVQYSTKARCIVMCQTQTMFKRPTIKRGFPIPKQFVTEIRPNGTRASTWVTPVHVPAIIPNGTPGRVGEIMDLIYKGADCVRRPEKTAWTPPMDYEFVAGHMPEADRAAYLAKCREWLEAHPKPVAAQIAAPTGPGPDRQLIQALFKKYPGAVPPFEERIKVYTAAGHSEAYITKAIARHQKLVETTAERQKALDEIFGKWPSASKTAPKPKAKVIKAVKKRT